MRRPLAIVLAALLALGVVLALVLPHLGSRRSATSGRHSGTRVHVRAIKAVIGSEKQPFFDDAKVVRRLRELGFAVTYDKAGSRQIATSFDLSGYDVAWPSSDTAAQRILATHKQAGHVGVFYSPMAIATWKPIVALLGRQGMAAKDSRGTWYIDMHKYLAAVGKDLRWSDIPSNVDFPVHKSLLVSTTDVRSSNSAAMYLALMSYVANGDSVVSASTEGDVTTTLSPLFLKQGFEANSSDGLFDTYLVQGIGAAPMAMVYEAQFLERGARHDGSITPDMVLAYPRPTVFSQHVLVTFDDAGKALGAALTSDPQLRRLEVDHGFRTSDVAMFRKFAARQGHAVPDQLVDVVDTPAYEVLESMIQRIERDYDVHLRTAAHARRAGTSTSQGAVK